MVVSPDGRSVALGGVTVTGLVVTTVTGFVVTIVTGFVVMTVTAFVGASVTGLAKFVFPARVARTASRARSMLAGLVAGGVLVPGGGS